MKKDIDKKKVQILENNKNLFQELLDSYDQSGFDGLRLKGPRISKQKPENFDLLNLLEYENERLQKVDHFLNIKLPNKNDHGVMEEILRQQKELCEKKKEELVTMLLPFNSSTHQSMKKIFNSAFKNNK